MMTKEPSFRRQFTGRFEAKLRCTGTGASRGLRRVVGPDRSGIPQIEGLSWKVQNFGKEPQYSRLDALSNLVLVCSPGVDLEGVRDPTAGELFRERAGRHANMGELLERAV